MLWARTHKVTDAAWLHINASSHTWCVSPWLSWSSPVIQPTWLTISPLACLFEPDWSIPALDLGFCNLDLKVWHKQFLLSAPLWHWYGYLSICNFMCLGVWLDVCLCKTCAVPRKDPFELWVTDGVSCHVGAENWIQVLWKNSQYFSVHLSVCVCVCLSSVFHLSTFCWFNVNFISCISIPLISLYLYICLPPWQPPP